MKQHDEALQIDRRQRLAAILVLSAVDLPAEAMAYCEHLIEVSKLLPGVTVNELRMNSRRESLEAARALIDEMLAEAV